MRDIIPVISIISILLFSCNNKKGKAEQQPEIPASSRPVAYVFDGMSEDSLIDTAYVRTGFYFLAKQGERGIRMRKEHSNEIYALQPTPFASVDNMADARVEKNRVNDEIYQELHLFMDEKGTRDLRKGTSKQLPYSIAIVVANRLLYVAEVQSPIAKGDVVVLLNDYSESEAEEMLGAIKQKR